MMDFDLQERIWEACTRPPHFVTEPWYEDSSEEPRIAYTRGTTIAAFSKRKASRRLSLWWREVEEGSVATHSTAKLADAKKRRFTLTGKEERISASLAALQRRSEIQLSPAEWRRVAEDADLEDQF